jgi:hypothetical protein
MRWIPWYGAFDPDTHGCFAAINVENGELHVLDFPTRKHYFKSGNAENLLDCDAMLAMLDPFVGATATIEDNKPGMSKFPQSIGSGQRIKGSIEMACAAKRIELEYVVSNEWKAMMLRDIGGVNAEKSAYVHVARELIPGARQVLLKSKHGRAAALLILYWKLLGEQQRFEHKAMHTPWHKFAPLRCELVRHTAKQLLIGG